MSQRQPPRNLPASIRQKLLAYARRESEDFQYVLTRYGLERLLYRISNSDDGSQFILKGAVLFQLWSGTPHRPTRDIDLLGQGTPTPEGYVEIFRRICDTAADEDDGLTFDTRNIRAAQIKAEDEYQGIRLRIEASLESARIPLQIDIGFGDAVTPGAIDVEYPTLLGQPAPLLKAYPRETVVAEKFHAMVTLGMANSRMKDFFDLWTLAGQFDFDGRTLSQALQATFARRATELPHGTPTALTEQFSQDPHKATQWIAFLNKGQLLRHRIPLAEVIVLLKQFLLPALDALVQQRPFDECWRAGASWQPQANRHDGLISPPQLQ